MMTWKKIGKIFDVIFTGVATYCIFAVITFMFLISTITTVSLMERFPERAESLSQSLTHLSWYYGVALVFTIYKLILNVVKKEMQRKAAKKLEEEHQEDLE